jgi:transcriptional regulator with XRE-family HTH domain
MAIDGQRVRELREASGLSQDTLATRARISRTTINKIEGGHQPLPLVAESLATALGVTVADISTGLSEATA